MIAAVLLPGLARISEMYLFKQLTLDFFFFALSLSLGVHVLPFS